MALHVVSGDSTGHKQLPCCSRSNGPKQGGGGGDCPNQGHLVPLPATTPSQVSTGKNCPVTFCRCSGWAPCRGLIHTVRALPGLRAHRLEVAWEEMRKQEREQLGERQLPGASKLPLRNQSVFGAGVGVDVKLCVPS